MDLKRSPDTLEDLKFVLGSIANIREIQLEVELQIFDICERYRTLEMYSIKVSVVMILLFESNRTCDWLSLLMFYTMYFPIL